MRRALVALLMLLGPALYAQTPSADWRTVETAHFRVHYPREYEEWSLRAAERLESIRDAVSAEVGFTPPQTIDVIIINPVAQPNGSAWPLLDTPRMIFFAEPPGPDEQLGAYAHWIDLLAVHETAHLVHMLRPSRHPLRRLIPLNPITLNAPRWVIEGYATVIEGRLTAAGRPNSTVRALILRRWAQNGRLPSYAQLNSDQRFLGMSMAYLMGSAFLEWLEQRSGPAALRNLWLRMTAREKRTFASAFTGVFGESAERLYGRFVAELTASAMAIDGEGELREGELFQETSHASGDPAVSPDGTRIAVVTRQRARPDALVIWSTEGPTEEEKRHGERIERMLKRDPEDVAPIRTKPLPRKAIHTLVMPDGGDIDAPRWMGDGKSILFSHRVPDADGQLHFDLYSWDFENVTRITNLADVRNADPFPDGRMAVAVRNRFGQSQLVDVDLSTGEVTERTPASIDVVETHPRVSPDGTRVAHVAHRAGRWALMIDDQPRSIDGEAATAEWTSSGELAVTVFRGGFAEIHASRDGAFAPITRTGGGAFQPAPAKDGRLFFMSLEPDGFVLRVLPSMEPVLQRAELDPSLAPAIPPRPPQAAGFTSQRLPAPRAYGVGRQENQWFVGGHYAPDDRAFEAGIRFGDVIGRLNTLVIASSDGAAVASAWRGWPIELGVHLFTSDDSDGGELRASWSRRFPTSILRAEAGGLDDELLFAGAQFSTWQVFGARRFEQVARVEVDGEHHRAIAALTYRGGGMRITARYQRDGGEVVTLGGIASSILPRSAYARRILDPALPVAILSGSDYDGWRLESSVPSMPFTAFYQRHDLDGATLSLAGLRFELGANPDPILKLPGIDVTVGAAYILDEPFRGETKWWLGLRWRP